MANDLLLTSSGGATLATDANASTEHFQLVKLVYGALNTAYNVVSSALPLPVASASSGVIQLSSATALSSGIVTLSSNPTVISASSGAVQMLTSGTLIVVNASSGLVQALTSGPLQVLATGPYQVLTSGTLVIVSASSGLVQTLTTGPLQVLTSGTLVVLNASSGKIQSLPIPGGTTSGVLTINFESTGGVYFANITAVPTWVVGWTAFNSTVAIRGLKLFNTTSSASAGSTANLIVQTGIPGSTGGGGNNLTLPFPAVFASALSVYITGAANTTSTGAPGAQDITGTLFYQT